VKAVVNAILDALLAGEAVRVSGLGFSMGRRGPAHRRPAAAAGTARFVADSLLEEGGFEPITRAGFTVRRAGLASISTPGQQASTRRHRPWIRARAASRWPHLAPAAQ